jgi:hypothetical protein
MDERGEEDIGRKSRGKQFSIRKKARHIYSSSSSKEEIGRRNEQEGPRVSHT